MTIRANFLRQGAVVLLGLSTTRLVAQERLWLHQFGTSETDSVEAVASDGVGGVFLTGQTFGNLGASSAGEGDVLLARYNSAGDRQWIRQFGSSEDEEASAADGDGAGGVFIAGRSHGGLAGQNSGDYDAWLARVDSAGDVMWVQQFGSDAEDWARGVCSDGAGGVYVAGRTEGALAGAHFGGLDAWIARYDADGQQIWVRQFGSVHPDRLYAIASDGNGGVFVGGDTTGALGGPPTGADAWLARYDGQGDQLWVRKFGAPVQSDTIRVLMSDGNGGAFIGGHTHGDLVRPNAGSGDIFLAQYDSGGSQLWIDQFGSSSLDYAFGLAPDPAGGSYVAGYSWGDLAFPGVGFYDVWLARCSGAGERIWIRQFGTRTYDGAYEIAPDGAGGVFVGGWTQGDLGGTNTGREDAWVARYSGDLCYPDCDSNGTVDVFDFLCFQDAFVAEGLYADCDQSTAFDVFDFLCFQDAFVSGCP